ncbi:MAG TPA: ATP-binding protein [Pseudomonadota bacterium]|nr:ATP-binding protein [Pseudomonadota bacterium]HNK43516.1 ATP-binding protein [Pseudomonadota bacterium]
MSIATRVTLLTVLLVTLALGVYGTLSMRGRRAERTAELERQTWLFGSALKVALEAAAQDGLYEDLHGLIGRMQAAERTIEVTYQDLLQPGEDAVFPPGSSARLVRQPNPDAGREERRRRVEITRQPYGEHIYISGREVYAYSLPIVDNKHRMVAIIDLQRDKSELEQEMLRATRDVVLTLGGLAALLAILVSLTVRQEFSAPLLRLVGGIDEVTRGDYTGAILRERNDEVGLLADRFNEMTQSLREARNEILAGVDAKLQLEQRLRHSDKLATIGQLAANIAHEVGTPLNVIGGRARVMSRRAEDPTAVQKNADIIATQAERITKIIQQLLDYARRKAPARSDVDLRKVCLSTLDFLEVQLTTRHVAAQLHPFAVPTPPQPESQIERAVRGDESLGTLKPPAQPIVVGDSDQLQQVCLNLCINAIQAMPEGGALDLSLEGIVRRKPGLDKAPPGAYVMLAVADTGIGIDEADLSRIFEPFYSTKTDGKTGKDGPSGSGLGLSVSAGIVKDLDGWIECERRPTGGTIFRVFLPAPEREEPNTRPQRSRPPARQKQQSTVPESEGNSFEAAPADVLSQIETEH